MAKILLGLWEPENLLVARALNSSHFVDMDELLCQRLGKSIKDYFLTSMVKRPSSGR